MFLSRSHYLFNITLFFRISLSHWNREKDMLTTREIDLTAEIAVAVPIKLSTWLGSSNWNYISLTRPNLFSISESPNPWIDEHFLGWNCWSTYFQALRLWKVRSGTLLQRCSIGAGRIRIQVLPCMGSNPESVELMASLTTDLPSCCSRRWVAWAKLLNLKAF